MAKDEGFELGNETNIVSLLIVGAATLAGIGIGWLAKHFLSKKQIKNEVREIIKSMTKNEIDKLFSGVEEPKTTVKNVKAKEIAPVQL